jgi:hypothetical protein
MINDAGLMPTLQKNNKFTNKVAVRFIPQFLRGKTRGWGLSEKNFK